jgi:hypothetical protein
MLKEQFKKNGYVIVRNVLNSQQVQDLRQLLNNEFIKEAETGRRTRRPPGSRLFQIPEIYMLLLAENVIKPMQEIFGKNFVILPDLIPQKDMCGDWHVDCASEIPSDYLVKSDYTFAKCGIYLQDNSFEWGGGIDVVPKQHKFPIKFLGPRLAHKIKIYYNRIGIRLNWKMVDTQAGDMVLFDSRLPHRSTFPNLLHTLPNVQLKGNTILGMPFEKAKFSLYYNVCSKISEAQDFMKNSIRRMANEKNTHRPYPDEMPFTDCLKFDFPDSFQSDFVSKIQQLGITLGCSNVLFGKN